MNPELVRKALDKVLNPNILVNLVSRRVRQLNSGNRPLLVVSPTLGAADVALSEIIEGKMNWDAPATPEEAEPAPASAASTEADFQFCAPARRQLPSGWFCLWRKL